MYLVDASFPVRPAPTVFAIPKVAGIPTWQMNLVSRTQEAPNLCWAACTQSILAFVAGLPVRQDTIVSRIHGLPVDAPATDSQITASLKVRVVSNDDRKVTVVRPSYVAGAPTPTRLIRELGRLRPILMKVAVGPDTAHAVVATSVTYMDEPWGPLILSLTYRDPSPTVQDLMNKGRVVVDGPQLPQFASTICAHWLIDVTHRQRLSW